PVILHYFGGMSMQRITSELKVKRPAIGTRLHRGRKMLAERLARQGVKLENATLASLLAVLVPASVVSAIVASAGNARVPASAATLPAAIARTLGAVCLAAARRPLRVAVVVLVLMCG